MPDEHIVNTILELLRTDFSKQPVLTRVITHLMATFIERLHGFSDAGFAPESMLELKIVIEELFGDTLDTLHATSIHSSHKELAAYKGYWEHPILGTFFKEKNMAFLKRAGDKCLKRVYVCDSLAEAVAEPWFRETVIEHVNGGASVKVIQIDPNKLASYEDFGIYQHKIETNAAGTYLLIAPKSENTESQELRTNISAGRGRVDQYQKKFQDMWGSSHQSEELIIVDPQTERVAEDNWMAQHHGEACINDLFNRRVILRKMERLDTNEKLLPAGSGFVRKYETRYAKALHDHLKLNYPKVKQLFYLGDTYKNDGAAIRNLQALGWNVTGFICEPKLKLDRLWFNSILYSNHWTDLTEFVRRISENCDSDCLAIFDIDQTLWAPKGIAEGPLNKTRIDAILKLVDEYVEQPKGSAAANSARIAKERIPELYKEVSEIKYHNALTLDNEDYKAAICIFPALNVVWSDELEDNSGAAFFEKMRDKNMAQFRKFVTTEYLPDVIAERGGEANMTHFIIRTMGAVNTDQFNTFSTENGLKRDRLRDAIRDILAQIVGPATVKFMAFRALELQEALALTASADINARLTLSKPTWDVAGWFSERNVPLLALSDRPDEATLVPGGESLLDTKMALCGPTITHTFDKSPKTT